METHETNLSIPDATPVKFGDHETLTITVALKCFNTDDPKRQLDPAAYAALMPSGHPTNLSRVCVWMDRAASTSDVQYVDWNDCQHTDLPATPFTFTFRQACITGACDSASDEPTARKRSVQINATDRITISLCAKHGENNPLIDSDCSPHLHKLACMTIPVPALYMARSIKTYLPNQLKAAKPVASPWEVQIELQPLSCDLMVNMDAQFGHTVDDLPQLMLELEDDCVSVLHTVDFKSEVLREFFTCEADGVSLPYAACRQSVRLTGGMFLELLNFGAKQDRWTVDECVDTIHEYHDLARTSMCIGGDATFTEPTHGDIFARYDRVKTLIRNAFGLNTNVRYAPDVALCAVLVNAGTADEYVGFINKPCESEEFLVNKEQDCEGLTLRMANGFNMFRSYKNKERCPIIDAIQAVMTPMSFVVTFGAAKGARVKVSDNVEEVIRKTHQNPAAQLTAANFNAGDVGGHSTGVSWDLDTACLLEAELDHVTGEVTLVELDMDRRMAQQRGGIRSKMRLEAMDRDAPFAANRMALARNLKMNQAVCEGTAPSCTDVHSELNHAAMVHTNVLRSIIKTDAKYKTAISNWHMRNAIGESANPGFEANTVERAAQIDFTVRMGVSYGMLDAAGDPCYGTIGSIETAEDGTHGAFRATCSPWEMHNTQFAHLNIAPHINKGLKRQIERTHRLAARPKHTMALTTREAPLVPAEFAQCAADVAAANPGVTRASNETTAGKIHHAMAFPDGEWAFTSDSVKPFLTQLKQHLVYFETEMQPLADGEFVMAVYMGIRADALAEPVLDLAPCAAEAIPVRSRTVGIARPRDPEAAVAASASAGWW
jgi:hypothetical protein